MGPVTAASAVTGMGPVTAASAATGTAAGAGAGARTLADTISDQTARDAMRLFRKVAISADAIARAILYAIEQPEDVDVSEIIVRPTASPH